MFSAPLTATRESCYRWRSFGRLRSALAFHCQPGSRNRTSRRVHPLFVCVAGPEPTVESRRSPGAPPARRCRRPRRPPPAITSSTARRRNSPARNPAIWHPPGWQGDSLPRNKAQAVRGRTRSGAVAGAHGPGCPEPGGVTRRAQIQPFIAQFQNDYRGPVVAIDPPSRRQGAVHLRQTGSAPARRSRRLSRRSA